MQTLTSRFTLPAPEFEFAGFSWPRRVAALPYGTLQSRILRRSVRTTSHYCHAPKPITGGEHPGRGGYHPNFPDRPFGLRWAWADEVLPHAIKHTGWYMDSEGYESIRGMILRLPRGRGWLAAASGAGRDHFPDDVKDHLRRIARAVTYHSDKGYALRPKYARQSAMRRLAQEVANRDGSGFYGPQPAHKAAV